MDSKEFEKFVVDSAKKYIFENEELDEKKTILKAPEAPKSAEKKLPKLEKPSFKKAGKNVNKLLPKAPKAPETNSVAAESVSPDKIKLLAEEMKKINKKIDLRNPLISPELFDIISEEKTVPKEEKPILKEEKLERWKNLYNYEIPKDDLR
jgi:hypothetical protein